MTRYILAALAFIAIVSVSYAGVVNSRLSSAQAALATARTDLAVAQQHADRVERDRATAIAALEDERTRAVAAERQAAALRMQIARDAGTDRDGPTAPVLRDAIRGVQPMSSATPWDLRAWHFIVVVDGRVLAINEAPTIDICRGLAGELAKELHATPEIILTASKVVLICQPANARRSA